MEETHHPVGNARKLIEAMTREEWARALAYAAHLRLRSRDWLDPEELLNDAVERTLRGSRRWKVGMKGPEHLFGAMKSLVDAGNRRSRTREVAHYLLAEEFANGEGAEVHSDAQIDAHLRINCLLASGTLQPAEERFLTAFSACGDFNETLRRIGLSKQAARPLVLGLIAKLYELAERDGL